MGNYRFKLSDMIPNAWFYKLKDMSRSGSRITSCHSNKKKQFSSTPTPTQHNQQQKQPISQSRRSYYYKPEPFKSDIHYNSPTNPKTSYTHFPDPPRKSSKTRIRRRSFRSSSSSSSSSKLLTSSSTSVSADCSCQAPLDSVWVNPDSTWSDNSASPLYSSPETNLQVSFPPLEFGSDPISSTDQFKELGLATNVTKDMKLESIPELELPRILTKPAKCSDMVSDIKKKDTEIPTKFRKGSAKLEEKNTHGSLSVKVIKEERIQTFKEQKTTPSIRRLKVRANSPRIASKKIQAYSRKTMSSNMSSRSQKKNVSESFAIVKSSIDPQRDFRDSMVEMIMENNIRSSKDLEELLVCYLSLNSNEYHDLIVKVFEQIWFDLSDIEL